MAGEFSVPSHTTYFAGYLDAVGRKYSIQGRLCSLTAHVMPTLLLDEFRIESATHVDRMTVQFEQDISRFLNADPKDPLVFYLVEYFGWYDDFSDTCTCEKLVLAGGGLSDDYVAYRLVVNGEHEVVFLASWDQRGHA